MSAGKIPHYIDPDHPNYTRWKRSRDISVERGKFVKRIISFYKEPKNLIVLDIGSGFGGTVQNFMIDNTVYSIELDDYKLNLQPKHSSVKKFLMDATKLNFLEKFDLIILQDFIEHIESPEIFLKSISKLLKADGIIYLSTPNKFSIINFISDPHWGFPFISLLSRKAIKKFFIPLFRKSEVKRTDFAALLSLSELIKIFNDAGFDHKLHTKFGLETLFKNPEQIVWSDLHLFLIKVLKREWIQKLIYKFASDEINLLNKFITPTFYFILRKKR